MKANQLHRLAIPKGNRFLSIIKNYLGSHGLATKMNPLFTARHMDYDHGLFESLNAFLTVVMVVDQEKRPRITKFLNSYVMRDLSNEEYRLGSENRDRQKALVFIQNLV